MMNWLRLIRWKNLLIVFLTQLLVWYCLIYDKENFFGVFRFFNFLLLSVSTLAIAAGGYIINDYFDVNIDVINRPDQVILDRKIPLRAAITAHILLSFTGLCLAFILAYKEHHYEWLLVQLVCIVLLWFYSTHFKRQYITGNVVVALLTSLTIIILFVYEPVLRMQNFKRMNLTVIPQIKPIYVCYGYAFFAFMLTLMREIVKDMEDFKGDAQQGCVTIPIRKGLRFATNVTQVLGIATLLSLGIFSYLLFQKGYIFLVVYSFLFIMFPIAVVCIILAKQNTTAHYTLISKYMKFITLTGIASLVIFHLTSTH
ncbi:MAG: geranylgeranylglycerol-phosphate geranylgeranyltransferase [Taibaiella sp.]|nr:geranylgeranylglycerol-phosphate geranylgeranyltransferase [Taibaiella sp.]